MVSLDSEFQSASIETERAIFAVESDTDFAIWAQLPSTIRQAQVQAWREMGPRARLAHDQRLVRYYREIGCESLLPEELRSNHDFTEFETWKKLAIEPQLVRFSGLTLFEAPVEHRGDKAEKRMIDDAIRRCGIGFESDSSPLFRTATGRFVYLAVRQRGKLMDAYLICSKIETPNAFANHCGLHGIWADCSARVPVAMLEDTGVLAREIVRHVEAMRTRLKESQ
jgi:hypothetical protein